MLSTHTPHKLLTTIALLLGAVSGAGATTNTHLAELLEELNQRVQKLEQVNEVLRHELTKHTAVHTLPASPLPLSTLEGRLHALEQQQAVLTLSLDQDNISEKEPDISARLKAVEARTQDLAGPVGKLKTLDGIKGGVSLTMVAQKSLTDHAEDGQLGYRTDAYVSLPLEQIGPRIAWRSVSRSLNMI